MNQTSDDPSLRVFFALWPSRDEQTRLAAWQPTLLGLAGGRIMRDDTLHTTLTFIGEIPPERLTALLLAAGEVDAERFDLCFDSAGYWGHNHIIHAAPGHIPPQLLTLVAMLEQRLHKHRFRFEPRAYKPHVTLLRNAHWTDQPLPPMRTECWRIRDFALVRSQPQQGSANYHVLARFPLRATEA